MISFVQIDFPTLGAQGSCLSTRVLGASAPFGAHGAGVEDTHLGVFLVKCDLPSCLSSSSEKDVDEGVKLADERD